ncbi:SH3 domain-containing protein [Tumidithrix helvetica PCC 7403]|uniref:hypothetical protein n=1 Tax=Tumidithrix helvetica TaxID=3457545 RepID=UPI003C894CA4
MNIRALLLTAIASTATLLPQFTPIATAQERSDCYVEIVGQQQGSRVNMRTGAGTEYGSPGFILVGQVVNMLNNYSGNRISRIDSEGATWFYVEYTPSRTRGWVREDFIAPNCVNY